LVLLDRLDIPSDALAGRTALITGAARGIGREAAGLFAHLGANIVIADIRHEGQNVADSIADAGGAAAFIPCDLADPGEAVRVATEAGEAFGPVDILINGAMHLMIAPIIATTLEEWERIFAVNLRASFLITKEMLGEMVQRGNGVIVNMIAYEGSPLSSAYAATKVGLRSLALTAAREIGPDAGVSVFAFVPGIVDTPVVRDILIPGFSEALGMPADELEHTVLAQNPGYAGLMPVEHCAAGLVYSIVHAPEYHGQVADPFEPLSRFGVIELPSPEESLSVALGTDAALPQHMKQFLSNVSERNRELEARIAIRTRELAEAHERSEALLLNVLPKPIAERLKNGEATIADSFDEATVLFADIVDFTPFAARLSPKEVVAILDIVFSTLDDIAETYHVEKIKTIGDCYMMVAGVPERRADHAEAIAEAALEIRDRVKVDPGDRSVPLSVRVGIHSGPLVAGVIGRRKFIYDLWGDTVNTASRMESHSLPDAIQCSTAAYERLRDRYAFEPRGEIDVKGKGSMQTYFLLGRAVSPVR
jgi:class 3 adenylate cyclase/NAD(P)-dependent dehydrogenase (short-subunit alcohol dehydrogenase family)